MGIITLAIDVPVDRLFDYHDGDLPVSPGSFVSVPFGKNKKVGIALEFSKESTVPPANIKAIHEILPIKPLSADFIDLVSFTSKYYGYPLGRSLATFLPGIVRKLQKKTKYQLQEYGLTDCGREKQVASILKSENSLRLWEYLKQNKNVSEVEIRKFYPRAVSTINKWIASGWAFKNTSNLKNFVSKRNVNFQRVLNDIELTEEQSTAIERIKKSMSGFKVWMLHGVTGSGKSEIYLDIIRDLCSSGGQALVLLPEINLTPEFEKKFKKRLPGKNVLSINSSLSETERFYNWEKARSGFVDVILGTRLAVFTELTNLRLIIVDEEHDSSYKQQDGLRYNARDMAIYRAKRTNIPVILGSATPSLETYKNFLDGKFERITMNHRPSVELPLVRIEDSGQVHHGLSISNTLIKEIKSRLAVGEQSLLFVNRRGFSASLVCYSCGWVSDCSRCSAKMTYHKTINKLICHYCGNVSSVADVCPKCGSEKLHGPGLGTQKLEDEVTKLFPQAKILRIDSDSTKRKNTFSDMRERIISGDVDIIVGTQMVTKGHNFPKLTLVGILEVDGALYSSDYAASEKLYQQLVQVSGRSGRGKQRGLVMVQTSFPNHFLFSALVRNSYDHIVNILLKEREAVGFPPYIFQVILRAESREKKSLFNFLKSAAAIARTDSDQVIVYDPVPAVVSKIANKHRGHLLVQAYDRIILNAFIKSWLPSINNTKFPKVRWSVDRDPIAL